MSLRARRPPPLPRSSGRRFSLRTTGLRILGSAAVALFLATAFSPLPNLLSHWMTPPALREHAGAIVVLGGGGIRQDGTLTDISLRRTFVGIRLYHQGLAPLVILAGAASARGNLEADVRAEHARECGVAPGAILTESSARTTREEATRIGALLQQRGVRKIILVADAEGMQRAVGVFTRRGFEVLPAPSADVPALAASPESRFALMRRVMIETIARIYYRTAGYL